MRRPDRLRRWRRRGGSKPTPPAEPPTPLPVRATSYENFKAVGLTPQVLPAGRSGSGTVRAYADFSRSGRLDLFTATLTYSPTQPIGDATPSLFEFWLKQADGSYRRSTALLDSANGCIHPRKAVVADFNTDGRPDVFVACHGFDAPPFPGEKNKLVVSQADGTYRVQDASDHIGFFHSATAADLNGDGRPDVVVTNNMALDGRVVFALINMGNNAFMTEPIQRFPARSGTFYTLQGTSYYAVELADVDGDGAPDLLLGGHEWESAPTLVFRNPGNFDFNGATPTVIPAVPGQGVVLDFAVTGTDANRALWVLRTSGSQSGGFYTSRVVQRVSGPALTTTTPLLQDPGNWFPWILPAVVNGQAVITSDDASVGVSLSQ